ncbi:hypothetical protein T3H97_16405 [Paenibacillus sp. LX16]|uniref:hypothetical protein n=1 Tax=unclassified Paenibacillus TaxID=185978 RepID=UPI001C653D21|nr:MULTISPECIES: hypothetical protein [unclassified Paenibacillus]QYK68282.1 hypothetical protein KAI36_03433 [Paenibacillus sp. S02]
MIYILGFIIIIALPILVILKHLKSRPLRKSYKKNFKDPFKKHIKKNMNSKNNNFYLESDKRFNNLLEFYKDESFKILSDKQKSINFLISGINLNSNLNNSMVSFFISTFALIFSLVSVFKPVINADDQALIIVTISSFILSILMDSLLEYTFKSDILTDLNDHLSAISHLIDLKGADKYSLLNLNFDSEILNKIRIINQKK